MSPMLTVYQEHLGSFVHLWSRGLTKPLNVRTRGCIFTLISQMSWIQSAQDWFLASPGLSAEGYHIQRLVIFQRHTSWYKLRLSIISPLQNSISSLKKKTYFPKSPIKRWVSLRGATSQCTTAYFLTLFNHTNDWSTRILQWNMGEACVCLRIGFSRKICLFFKYGNWAPGGL